jgi:nucleotide-binding universal stress UspA family protein
MWAMRLAAPLARLHEGEVVALYVEREAARAGRRWRPRRRGLLAGTNLDEHLRRAAEVVGPAPRRLAVRRASGADVAGAVLEEAGRDYDLLMVGAAQDAPLHDPLTRRIVEGTPVPVVIVRSPAGPPPPLRSGHILVPVDGSVFSRHAVEFAFAYAGAAGGRVTLLHVVHATDLASGSFPVRDRRAARVAGSEETAELEARLERELGPVAERFGAHFSTRIVTGGSPGETIVAETESGYFDLLVLGAENKLLGQPLFFRQGTAEILERAGCATAVVVARV